MHIPHLPRMAKPEPLDYRIVRRLAKRSFSACTYPPPPYQLTPIIRTIL